MDFQKILRKFSGKFSETFSETYEIFCLCFLYAKIQHASTRIQSNVNKTLYWTPKCKQNILALTLILILRTFFFKPTSCVLCEFHCISAVCVLWCGFFVDCSTILIELYVVCVVEAVFCMPHDMDWVTHSVILCFVWWWHQPRGNVCVWVARVVCTCYVPCFCGRVYLVLCVLRTCIRCVVWVCVLCVCL